MKPYKYHPLGRDDFTRILQLHPATDCAAPLRCDLQHCRFQKFSYCAVSYAWGTPLFTGTLSCDSDDEHIQITPSLDAVLRALRSPLEMRELWVDAVCINQQDTDEKSRQVRVMSEIYRKARQVIAWVGEDYDDASKVLRFFKKHAKEFSLVDHDVIHGASTYQDPHNVEGMKAIAAIEKSICETFGTRGLAVVRKFFLRPWFKRRWIIQEVVLAAKAIIRCGSTSMDFSSFALSATAMNLFYEQQEGGHVLDPQSLIDDHIARMLSGIESNRRSKTSRGMRVAGFRFPILALLHRFHPAQCSDDRDRIYALLGLSDDLVPKLDVDHAHKRLRFTLGEMSINYEVGAVQVYTTLALKLMDSDTFGQPLHSAGALRSADRTNPNIPSWVPDWRNHMRFSPMRNSHFSAGPTAQEDDYWKVSDDRKVLYLQGWRHSIVSKKSGGVSEISSFEQLKQSIQQWWRFYTSLRKEQITGTDTDLTLKASRYTSFFDCVTMSRECWTGNLCYPPKNFVDLLFEVQNTGELIWNAVFEPKGDESSTRDNEAQLSEKQFPRVTEHILLMRTCTKLLTALMKGRSLFRSEKGELMNCPDDTEIGDIVVVFEAADTPFVIRPSNVASTTCGKKQSFSLIGDCYVEGIMKRDFERKDMIGDPSQFLLV